MHLKVPVHVARETFSKTVRAVEQVRTSSSFLMRGRCPLCNDYKKRMYLKEYNNLFLVYCHNCGYSHSLEVFLKNNFEEEYRKLKKYIIDSLCDRSAFKKSFKQDVHIKTMSDEQINTKLREYIKMVSFSIGEEQSNTHLEKFRAISIKYLTDRRIPEPIFKDFVCIHAGPLAGYVGIPFFDESKKNLIHVQGRLVISKKDKKQSKYMFLKDLEYNIELENKPIWGQWRVKEDNPVIICEGTLDACAFENGVATCGATLSESFIRNVQKKYKNRIWCVDSYWLDTAGRDLTRRLVKFGESCFIIPHFMIQHKDANDLIKTEFKDFSYIPVDFVKQNIVNTELELSRLNLLIK